MTFADEGDRFDSLKLERKISASDDEIRLSPVNESGENGMKVQTTQKFGSRQRSRSCPETLDTMGVTGEVSFNGVVELHIGRVLAIR